MLQKVHYPSMLSTSFFYRLLLGGVLTVYIAFGTYHLEKFLTADEHYWVSERIPRYWNALSEGKWIRTFINDKPGISIALVSGVGTLLYPYSEDHCPEQENRLLACNTEVTGPMYQAFRFPLLLTNGLLLIVLFFLIERLWNSRTAFFTVLFSAWSPILLGISQIVNPDTLLWSFGAVALFSYFSLLYFEEKKYFFLTLFSLTFAVLSKYVALVLLPFFLAVAVFRFLSQEDTEARSLLKKDILSWLCLVCGTGILVCFFVPALLLDAKYIQEFIQTVPDREKFAFIGGVLFFLLLFDTFLLKNFLLQSLRRVRQAFDGCGHFLALFFLILFGGLIMVRNFFPDWSLFTLIAFDLKDLSDARYYTDIPNFFEAFLLEWNPVVFSLTPIVLLSFAWLLISLFRKKYPEKMLLVCSILFFFVAYSVLLIFSNVLTTPRYSILLYPLFSFLGALGLSLFLDQHVLSAFQKKMVIGGGALFSLWSLFLSAPFYFNYTNALLPQNALIQDAWGYGGYEAARYLNGLPDAKNLTVWADYYGVCEFFVGKCLTAYTFNKEEVRPDYYVLTRRGQIRYMSRADRWERLSGLTAYKYYSANDPAWQLLIDHRPGNFIKVVKVPKDE
jgi:4-amino-4-deoxy-L-arabinose transferase-like glycosyltransferase